MKLIKKTNRYCFMICKNKIFFITALAFIIIIYLSISNILEVNNTFANSTTGPCNPPASNTTKTTNAKTTIYKCEWNDNSDKKYKLNLYPLPQVAFVGHFLIENNEIYLKSGTIIIHKGDSITVIGDEKKKDEYYKKLSTINGINILNECNQIIYNKISSSNNMYGVFSTNDIKKISKITTNIIHNNYKDPDNNRMVYKRTANLILENGYTYCGKLEKNTESGYLLINNSTPNSNTPVPTTPPGKKQIIISDKKLYKLCTTAIIQFKTDLEINPNNISLILYDENNKRIKQVKPTVNELDSNFSKNKNKYHEITLINLKKKTYYFQIQIKTDDNEITDDKYILLMNKDDMKIDGTSSGCFGRNISVINLQ